MKLHTVPCEAVGDFSFYDSTGSVSQSLSSAQVHTGTGSHLGQITAANAADNENSLVHRAYGYIQFDQMSIGVFRTPVLATVWVWLDLPALVIRNPLIDDWFSFATLSCGTDAAWTGLFTVNLNPQGYAYLYHVPTVGLSNWTYQASAANGGPVFPMRQWVKLEIYYYGHAVNGFVRVFQDGVRVSEAPITGGNGTLARVHFGMYASPAVGSGLVYNDDISITECYWGGTKVPMSLAMGMS
jgi:hypothetical protein